MLTRLWQVFASYFMFTIKVMTVATIILFASDLFLSKVFGAEKFQIINPPRPNHKYRHLFLIESRYSFRGAYTKRTTVEWRYIYLNDYAITTDIKNQTYLLIYGPYETCTTPPRDEWTKPCKLYEDSQHSIYLYSDDLSDIGLRTSSVISKVLKAKAPDPGPEYNPEEAKKINKITPKKAKVVFTNKK